MCRECLRKSFTHPTISNMTFGWWGAISFGMTRYYLHNNVTTYVSSVEAA